MGRTLNSLERTARRPARARGRVLGSGKPMSRAGDELQSYFATFTIGRV